MRELADLSRDLVSLDQTVGSDDDAALGDFIADERATGAAEENIEAGLMRAQLSAVLDTLGEREAAVVRMRYGLDGGQPKTLDEIGRAFRLSRERIRQIERETMAKLRHPTRAPRFCATTSKTDTAQRSGVPAVERPHGRATTNGPGVRRNRWPVRCPAAPTTVRTP